MRGELSVPSQASKQVAARSPVAAYKCFTPALLPAIAVRGRRSLFLFAVVAFVANLVRKVILVSYINKILYSLNINVIFTLAHSVQQHNEPVRPQVLHSKISCEKIQFL
jgi:hypothetical protein